jgi:hypothetical protein
MRRMLWFAGIALLASSGHPAIAAYCENGQMPAPPAVAARMALPLCGFAATKRWGPNGCQLCDARNMYPNPYGYEARRGERGAYRAHGYRDDSE